MQLCNLTVRLGGSLLHTVPMIDVTPAEILVLKSIHGQDAVVDIIPTKMGKTRQDAEWDRLVEKYDRASVFNPNDKSVMGTLFPGAMKKLPVSLKEIGLGHLMSPFAAKDEPAPVDPKAEYEDTAAHNARASGEDDDVDEDDPDSDDKILADLLRQQQAEADALEAANA